MEVRETDAYEGLIEFLYRVPIALAQLSASGGIEMLNPKCAQLLMPIAGGQMENMFDVLAGVAPELRRMALEFGAPSGTVCDAMRVHLPAGSLAPDVPAILALTLVKLDPERFMMALQDVTREAEREQQQLAQELRQAAHIDSLTHIPNRLAVREKLQEIVNRVPYFASRSCAVLFMNCDRFRQINDAFGNGVGDQVLQQIADRLRLTLRHYDVVGLSSQPMPMTARFGSDEFVVILDGIRRIEDITSVAARVMRELQAPHQVGQHQIICPVSMGIATCGDGPSDADILLQDANIAMAEAKRAGGARFCLFEPEMRERAVRRGGIEAELRRALQEEQLFVVYQPVVGFASRSDIDHGAGVEALVRWRHPQRGLVSPVDFIGVAEESGLIGAIGDFVLRTACRDFMQWQRLLGPAAPRSLAVNLSRAQLSDPDMGLRFMEILRSTEMPPSALQLEVTESLAAQDETMLERLRELRANGIRLALDDFGTGYSSLSCLHLLPVETVKIDRSFVSQVDTSSHHRVLIDATVRVAHSLNMITVAEGIETEAQAEAVQELACDKGQGYLFSRPLPAEELLAWLLARGYGKSI
ncbi:diguanylate cyclase (GGDEF) domain-containing protein [Noviherbaspirillum humi]|uniref:Diguanylate cyclase (GGDEF) domain-containing protein n=1 Tax=Noviherbaspirillum humi TaxID=1688639 RepID=A0A239I1V0_9BURK|nr:bifunctional diguanylate cyclase/phosphodiesterase [Noviherbaspirillum humi]SNS87461.1 diguanylate cyclase (GGDEF) domain-containing protein [Noviherbaspirillum humi]